MEKNLCPCCQKVCATDGACTNPNCTMVTEPPAHRGILPSAPETIPAQSGSSWTDDGSCPRCGRLLMEDFAFCPSCGRKRLEVIDPYALIKTTLTHPALPSFGKRDRVRLHLNSSTYSIRCRATLPERKP